MPDVRNYQGGQGSNYMPGAREIVIGQTFGSPLLGSAAYILAATATAAASVVTAGLANPDVPRTVTATPGGTTANVLAVSVIIKGTSIEDAVITETLPAFTVGSGASVTGLKAFKTITSVTFPVIGAATSATIGTSSALALNHRIMANVILMAFLGLVREATLPTVTVDVINIENNTITLASALNGSPVDVLFVAYIR